MEPSQQTYEIGSYYISSVIFYFKIFIKLATIFKKYYNKRLNSLFLHAKKILNFLCN
jgi:hypothetical protein